MTGTPRIGPCFCDMDALSHAFGLAVVEAGTDDSGIIQLADMSRGNGEIMPGTVADGFQRSERVAFGTRRYRDCDPRGHEWSFGTDLPRAEASKWR